MQDTPTRTDYAAGLDRRIGGRDVLPDALIQCSRELTPLLEHDAPLETMRAVVRRYVRSLRASAVPPERAVSAFKFMLSAQPAMQQIKRPEHMDRATVLSGYVIDEYYAAFGNESEEPDA